jgi:SWI/SNF-related matrix-associated actin-dependent regulator of chromatin subfamily A-like protein 1
MNAVLIGSIIRVRFKYDRRKILQIKLIPESKWDKASKSWLVPASPWHAWKLYEIFPDMEADKFVKHLAQCKPYFRMLSERKDHPNPQFQLYPYQQAAVEYIESCNGRALIADSMGLGKSAVACAYARRNGLNSILVVCPATIKHKWSDELRRWYNPECQPIIVDGSITPRANIIIMSYERMRMNRKDLEERNFDLMIIDEVQAVKNPKALRTKAAKSVSARAKNIVGLSATPMMNRPIDLWSELHVLRPWEYSNYWNFGHAYAGGQYASFKGATRQEELRDRLSSIMIRRKKDDVLRQLPDLTRSIMWAGLTEYGAGLYGGIEAEVKEALRKLSPNHKGYFASALDRITALRQGVGAAKSDLAADFISNFLDGTDDNNKIVVSCYFMKTIEGISERLKEPHIIMTGKDNHHVRADKVKKFRNPGEERVFIMSAVGSEGIDLFGLDGSSISDILMVDRNWLPTSEEQTEGRLHRIGQTFPVTAHYLLAQNTIDVYMTNIVERKRAVGEVVANQGEVIKELVERILSDEQ